MPCNDKYLEIVRLVILCAFLATLSKADDPDVTTIFKFQLDSKGNPSIDPLGPQCQVYIHTGGTGQQIPYLINDEIVVPEHNSNYNLVENDAIDIEGNEGTDSQQIEDSESKTSNVLNNKERPNENIEDHFSFDSNQMGSSHWTYNNRTHITKHVHNMDTVNLGPMFSKLLTRVKAKFTMDDINQNKLNNIVLKNNSKSFSSKKNTSSNIPYIIRMSKQFATKCEGCHFDFYKIKNGSKWELVIIRDGNEENDQSFRESTEETLEIENHPTVAKQETVFQNNEGVKDNSQNLETGEIKNLTTQRPNVQKETPLEINSSDTKSRQTRNLLRANRDEEHLTNKMTSVLNDQQVQEIKSTDKEIVILSKQKLHQNSILKTKLLENSTYILKIRFKTQSYFKVTFVTDNATSDRTEGQAHAFQMIDITMRGTCVDSFEYQGSRTTQVYLDINSVNDFQTIPINVAISQNLTLEIMFIRRKFINLKIGFFHHQIALHGADLSEVQFFNVCFENDFNGFQFELYEAVTSYFTKVVLPLTNASNPSLTSPWLNNTSPICWTILFTNMSRHSSDYDIVCYDDASYIENDIGMKVEIENYDGRTRQIYKYCLETNGDIVQMMITYEKQITDTQIVRFLIHMTNSVGVRYIYRRDCKDEAHLVKQGTCNTFEKVAFDVAYKHNYHKKAPEVQFCLNQGRLLDGRCLCPPGFAGNHCEEACGEAKFGTDCSGQCSQNFSDTDQEALQCKGMLLCNLYGCGCASGYQGKYCTQTCPSGQYGNDCRSRCGQCLNGTTCNAYTGHCVQCANSYLVPPYCQESYPYVAQPLKVLNNSYFSVQLEVNAQAQYVKGYPIDKEAEYFFIILTTDLTLKTEQQTKEFPLDLAHPKSNLNVQKVWIENLIPGHMYSFHMLLSTSNEIGNTNDPAKAPRTNVTTKCTIPVYEHRVRRFVTSTTIQLYWAVTNVSYEDWNKTKEGINSVYNNSTTINGINRLFNYTTKVEMIEDLYNLTNEQRNLIFKCRKPNQYFLTVKKITKKKAQEYTFNNLNSGFMLKYLDPGSKYFVRLYVQNNNHIHEIFSQIVETDNNLSEMDDLELVKKMDKAVIIKWNTNISQSSGLPKATMVTKTINETTEKTKQEDIKRTESAMVINETLHEDETTRANLSDQTKGETIYYIKYKIYKQRACNQYFNRNTYVIATNKTEYKLELEYFTTYQIFITQNKGQTLARKYLYVTLDARMPDVSPSLLHLAGVTNHSAVLGWADISLSSFECAKMNGMFVTYEVELRNLEDNSTIAQRSEELEVDIDGLSPGTEYLVKLRYVNHLGKNPERFSSIGFRTLS